MDNGKSFLGGGVVLGRKGSIHVQIGRRSHQLPSVKASKALRSRQIYVTPICGDLLQCKHRRCSASECLPHSMFNKFVGDIWSCRLRFGGLDNEKLVT